MRYAYGRIVYGSPRPSQIEQVESLKLKFLDSILFPWAECNLKELFQGQNPIISTPATYNFQWLLRQMSGLADGLSFIHSPHHKMGSVMLRGRHGDLHTENVLLMRQSDRPDIDLPVGNLQIASFGMAKYTRRGPLGWMRSCVRSSEKIC